ncbi:pimeloyl-ACP methyl ester carboxylesterase [Chitinivorax tropicus]|uniref:Pimeloyl-ACP methyl ester carboxylesterase n=1 Tax=Chitinivorax tropicus TaxID=714531 RepID=A0A840MJ14_9PROT|nr:alpha/beta hydrolase [Chitinivorax tropicus]MBB5018400.1 pimeloyl-ACP methyl ester carboxylesterase [Chitinivorax tropicus]
MIPQTVPAKDRIQFSHANGFPAGSYRQLFAALADRFDIDHIDTIGHDPRYPVTEGWPHLVTELIHDIERHSAYPVIGVGHSLGGFLTYLTAIQRPDLFRVIILLDSPIMGRLKSAAVGLSKRLGMMEHITPAGVCKHRRAQWPSKADAVRYFQGKPLFAKVDPQCLADYVEHGTIEVGQGVRLRFDPRIEYQIYCSLPHRYPETRGRLRVPAAFIGGAHSNVVDRSDIANMRRHHGMECRQIQGGHLFPLEYPAQTANMIHELVLALG